jgi:putative membrane protein
MYLTQQEQQQINELVAEVEAATGAQVLATVIGKADSYPEIPWRAFASGAVIAAFSVVVMDWLRPGWISTHSAIFDTMAILGTAATLSLLTIFSPPVARLFLDRLRADTEAKQYAQSMFLEREVFHTRQRIGALLLVSQFERAVVILSDEGIRSRVNEAELHQVIAHMTPLLARGETAAALRAGLQAFKARLLEKGFGSNPADTDEITTSLVQEKGV